MDHRAITKAESRLRSALDAINRMRTAANLQAFSDHWYEFLVARRTFGRFSNRARSSPRRLASGLAPRKHYAAETLSCSTSTPPEMTMNMDSIPPFKPSREPLDRRLQTRIQQRDAVRRHARSRGKMKVTSLDGKPVLIEQQLPYAHLVPVKDRDPSTIWPVPDSHLGQKLSDQSPILVAELGLAFLTNLVENAKTLK